MAGTLELSDASSLLKIVSGFFNRYGYVMNKTINMVPMVFFSNVRLHLAWTFGFGIHSDT